jgi:DNA repair exonuclease SbcCD nuclease subunit
MFKVLLIGDPHFKQNNTVETELMHQQIEELIKKHTPLFVVVLGDILDRFERIDLFPLMRAIKFLSMINSLTQLYVIIGNHDRPNNNVFLTDEHPFNSLKEWKNTKIVDTVSMFPIFFNDKSYNFLFVPYVQNGRLKEALSQTIIDDSIVCVFSHQDYDGSKLSKIRKGDFDIWDKNYPMNFSGHLHDYEEVQDNLIYVGTPIQHGSSDICKKTISLLEYTTNDKIILNKHKRIELCIPKKIILNMTLDQIMTFEPIKNSSVVIKFQGSITEYNSMMKIEKIKKLLELNNIKIQLMKEDKFKIHNSTTPLTSIIFNTSFKVRLLTAVNNSEEADVFHSIFSN